MTSCSPATAPRKPSHDERDDDESARRSLSAVSLFRERADVERPPSTRLMAGIADQQPGARDRLRACHEPEPFVLVDALPARRIIELGRYPHSGWFGRLTPRDREAVER